MRGLASGHAQLPPTFCLYSRCLLFSLLTAYCLLQLLPAKQFFIAIAIAVNPHSQITDPGCQTLYFQLTPA
jgi:hypothetical protein